MADTEIPGSYRWVFLDGPRTGETVLNQTGSPSTIDGDAAHVYQLVMSPDYVPDIPTAPDVAISVYEWVELPAPTDEVGSSYN